MESISESSPSAGDIIRWLDDEGIVELGSGFEETDDLFVAGLDSMAVMQLVVAAEERFGVVLGPEDIKRESLATPAALAGLIARKLA